MQWYMHTHYVIEGLSEENPMIFLILSFFNNTSIRVHSLYSPITSQFSFSFIIYQLPRKTKKFLPPHCYGLETIVQVYCREQRIDTLTLCRLFQHWTKIHGTSSFRERTYEYISNPQIFIILCKLHWKN